MNPTTTKTDNGADTTATAPGTGPSTEPGTTPRTAPETAAGPQDHQPEHDDEHAAEFEQEQQEQQEPREQPEARDGAERSTGPGGATGLAAAAAAVVATALGIASLTGTWMGRVAAERETLIGQIATSQSGSPAQQISEIYGDAWHTTALVNGLFAVVALITGLVVLIRSQRPLWIRAVALAGAVLGGLGLLLSAGMYADLFLPLPSTRS
ncbi:hypothetical protein [Streptomyces sp. NPDC000229]|uniref:hypothetical protein n=1 Tax=Streptomyces sp. NPDC000229 TaxID=3154247 RepID=UPI003329A784